MKYFFHRDFIPSVQVLHLKGGQFKKAAQVVMAEKAKIDGFDDITPLEGIKQTNNGESRIRHCIKYQLAGGCRLITVKDKNVTVLLFAGTHKECDKWLNKNKGLEIVYSTSDNVFKTVHKTENILNEEKQVYADTDFSKGYLYEKISEKYYNLITQGIDKRTLLIRFEKFTSITDVETIKQACKEFDDDEKSKLFFDVFMSLRRGDSEEAKSIIDLYSGKSISLKNLTEEDLKKLTNGEQYFNFEQFGKELYEHILNTTNYQQWMLFMHSEQKKIVDSDFKEPAKLSGVSGSGKTCIVIKRAIRLAEIYPDQKVLILTLNKALATLIKDLFCYACPEKNRKNIDVFSFWELCQILLKEFENKDFNKYYNNVTWKNNEHITDIWREYYTCENNNNDAEIFFDIHKSLLARDVYPKEYLYQELNYIRSAFSPDNRLQYLNMERQGRSIPFDTHNRNKILKGLDGWEDKMNFVGITDYLGLATALYYHLDKLNPRYRSILVDEVQDFGTIELKIIRKLVAKNTNDVFLCGDHAQQVYTKYHNPKEAGINLTGRFISLRRNYRNSREILAAAYHVLYENSTSDDFSCASFSEIYEPEYANFSTIKPVIIHTDSLKKEFGYCFHFLAELFKNENKKACIVLCGYSLKEVKLIGTMLHLPVLDGSININNSNIFLSDLEQTKGFEFDMLCILNCNYGIIPNHSSPHDVKGHINSPVFSLQGHHNSPVRGHYNSPVFQN